MKEERPLFDRETWASLPGFFNQLPEPVRLHVWGDEQASQAEWEAAHLARTLGEHFASIDWRLLPRRVNYPYYPVIGVMGLDKEADEAIDYGVRIIGLPAGYQMTSLVAAIQSVSFKGMTSEAKTRIQLHRLDQEVRLELITSAEDEGGSIMAHRAFNMAIASPWVRSFLIMGDVFPEALIRYSVTQLPHLVINDRVHLQGVVDDEIVLKHIARALGPAR